MNLSTHLTPRSKKILILALKTAVELDHDYIATEHILAGLLREQKGLGPRILRNHGITMTELAAAAGWPRSFNAEGTFDLAEHLRRQRLWSDKTFGPGPRTAGVLDHIRKELAEIEETPSDLEEWVDVLILAFDGATRIGHSPEDVIAALLAKQQKNEARQWPDWRSQPLDKAITHVKESPPREDIR